MCFKKFGCSGFECLKLEYGTLKRLGNEGVLLLGSCFYSAILLILQLIIKYEQSKI